MRQIGPRVKVGQDVRGLKVRIRAPRIWGALLFLPVWFAGWTFGGVMAARAFVKEPQLFLAVWLVGWLAGELFALLAWSWIAFGEEIVAVRESVLTLEKRIGPLALTRHYPLHEASNLRAAGWFGSPMSFSDSMRPWGLSGGTVAFDYNGKTVRFGIGLDEKDARSVAEELAPHVRAAA